MDDNKRKVVIIGNDKRATELAKRVQELVDETTDVVINCDKRPLPVSPGLSNGPLTRLIFAPGEIFQRVSGEQYEVRNDGSYRRLNKPFSKKKRRRLDAVLRAQGSSLPAFVSKMTKLRERHLGVEMQPEAAINSPVPVA